LRELTLAGASSKGWTVGWRREALQITDIFEQFHQIGSSKSKKGWQRPRPMPFANRFWQCKAAAYG